MKKVLVAGLIFVFHGCGKQNPRDPSFSGPRTANEEYSSTFDGNPEIDAAENQHSPEEVGESNSRPRTPNSPPQLPAHPRDNPSNSAGKDNSAGPDTSHNAEPETPTTPPSDSKSKNANLRLLEYYSKSENYSKVFKEVLAFYPEGRSNGCVAFLSSALRQSGTPISKNKWINGYNVSLVTIALSQQLEELNWTKITDPNVLRPGDIVMTLPPKKYPGIPAHTYMFQSWRDKKNGIGLVIDNQDFTHERNIFGSGTYNFTPFWYALRARP